MYSMNPLKPTSVWNNFIATGGLNSLLFTSLNFLWFYVSWLSTTKGRRQQEKLFFCGHFSKVLTYMSTKKVLLTPSLIQFAKYKFLFLPFPSYSADKIWAGRMIVFMTGFRRFACLEFYCKVIRTNAACLKPCVNPLVSGSLSSGEWHIILWERKLLPSGKSTRVKWKITVLTCFDVACYFTAFWLSDLRSGRAEFESAEFMSSAVSATAEMGQHNWLKSMYILQLLI